MLETNSEGFKNRLVSSIEDEDGLCLLHLQHPETGLDIFRMKARHHNKIFILAGSLVAGQERPHEGTVEPQGAGLDWWGDWVPASDQEVALRAETPHIRHNAGVAERLQLYHPVGARILLAGRGATA